MAVTERARGEGRNEVYGGGEADSKACDCTETPASTLRLEVTGRRS